jgi:hypothetical protein
MLLGIKCFYPLNEYQTLFEELKPTKYKLALLTRRLVLSLSLFVWLVADGWCWFVLREKYCSLVVGGWFALREKYCWLVADKPSEQGDCPCPTAFR